MSVLTTSAALDKGNALCTHLKTRGLKPVWLEAVDDQLAIGFEFISEHPTWTKAFRHDAVHVTPDGLIGQINEWKNKVRKDIVMGTPSTIVKNMISAHGIMAVLDAMEDTKRDRSH